jgi:prevent-host-death family protein
MSLTTYDVIITGGGLAGLCLARQLRQEHPDLTVLVAEKKQHPVPEAAHKVGESSVEIGAHYFSPMDTEVSAADANRRFSELLRRARDGHTTVITSHGRPVARLVPMTAEDERRAAARRALFTRLREAPVVDAASWTRDELYDEP